MAYSDPALSGVQAMCARNGIHIRTGEWRRYQKHCAAQYNGREKTNNKCIDDWRADHFKALLPAR
jgi:hypothetical protein